MWRWEDKGGCLSTSTFRQRWGGHYGPNPSTLRAESGQTPRDPPSPQATRAETVGLGHSGPILPRAPGKAHKHYPSPQATPAEPLGLCHSGPSPCILRRRIAILRWGCLLQNMSFCLWAIQLCKLVVLSTPGGESGFSAGESRGWALEDPPPEDSPPEDSPPEDPPPEDPPPEDSPPEDSPPEDSPPDWRT